MKLYPSLFFALPLVFGGIAGCEDEPQVEETPLAVDQAPAGEGAVGEADAEPEAPAKPGRRFLLAEGTVTLDGQPAAVDTEIPAEAVVKTGKDGRAVITIIPGSIAQIGPNSEVSIGKSDRKDHSLKLVLGAIWSMVADGSSYEVVTQNAVAGVRGTAFYVEAHNKKSSYICACDGAVEIGLLGTKKKPNLVESKMEHLSFNIKGKKPKSKKAKRKNHTEEEKMALMPFLEQVK